MIIMKSFYFTHKSGMCIKIMEIPVLESQDPLAFQVNSRFQLLINKIQKQNHPPLIYSFRDYLRNTMKWSEFSKAYNEKTLEQNAKQVKENETK